MEVSNYKGWLRNANRKWFMAGNFHNNFMVTFNQVRNIWMEVIEKCNASFYFRIFKDGVNKWGWLC